MDKIIKQYDYVSSNDLNLCVDNGVAYQADMTIRKKYDNYFKYCHDKYINEKRKTEINNARKEFVLKHYGTGNMIDIGIGDGSFLLSRSNTYGHDNDFTAMQWLAKKKKVRFDFRNFKAFSMWDVLEHVETPNDYFEYMVNKSWLFISIPIFKDLKKIRESKHYRPGEHLYYFTEIGLLKYLKEYDFECKDIEDFEIKAGREDIYSFAFKRNLK